MTKRRKASGREGEADVDVDLQAVMMQAPPPHAAALIHAERACHSDPRLCMSENPPQRERKREAEKETEREKSTN